MTKIDDIFNMFENGKMHKVGEIARKISLPRSTVRKILNFLAEFNFIEFDRRKGKAKASSMGMRILSRGREAL